MASDEPRIKVRRHREEERVVYAGAPSSGEESRDAQAPSPAKEEGPGEARSSTASSHSATSKEPFRETTLDDIESSTMSGLQKGIIVGAVLIIVGCIAWYVLFMT